MGLRRLLVNTCTIRTFSQTSTDGYGDPTGTWSEATEACSLQPRGGREGVSPDRAVVGEHDLYLGPGATITEQSQVVVGGRVYDVVNVMDPAGRGHHVHAVLKEVR
ncbi:MAG: hypothetical protein GHCLOJNM_01573 [bacterium]|nr:hypothetical protein [bacterium]